MDGYIYLDNQATTPIDPRVCPMYVDAMSNCNANPGSTHHLGKVASRKMYESKESLNSFINGESLPYITASATESINIAIKSLVESAPRHKRHVVTQVTEHKAVLESCHYLEKNGFHVTYVGVDHLGQIDLDELKAAVTSETIMVSVMHANNEIGVIHPIMEIGSYCRRRDILFLVDAAQTFGKLPIDVRAMNIDYLIASSHKIYAPKGMGMLYASKRGEGYLRTYIHGGGQENNIRGGTPNVPLLVAFAEASRLAYASMEEENTKISRLRDKLLTMLQNGVDCISVNGSMSDRLAGNLNICVEGVDNDMLIRQVSNYIALSPSSACLSVKQNESYVLQALKKSKREINSSFRISLGRFNTESEIETAAGILIDSIQKIRTILLN